MTIVAQVTAMGDGSMVTGEYLPQRSDRHTAWTADNPPPCFSGGSYRGPLTPVPDHTPDDVATLAVAGLLGLTFDEAPRRVLYEGMTGEEFRQRAAAEYLRRRGAEAAVGLRKLSDEDVLEIRARYAAGGVSQERLGCEYGVHQTTVSDLVRGRKYRDVDDSAVA